MSERNEFNQRVINEFRANQGKVGGQMAGLPLLLLTTTGAKTGRALIKPLAYKDGDRIFVIASFAGSPNNPAWFNNLVANPTVTVRSGKRTLSGQGAGYRGRGTPAAFQHSGG